MWKTFIVIIFMIDVWLINFFIETAVTYLCLPDLKSKADSPKNHCFI